MKWSLHPSNARHDLRCQELLAAFRSSGYGAYWIMLEAVAEYSNSRHLKVSGLSHEIDAAYQEAVTQSPRGILFSGSRDVSRSVPELSHRVLAKQCCMGEGELRSVIEACAAIGLFDPEKWLTYNVLYSPELETRSICDTDISGGSPFSQGSDRGTDEGGSGPRANTSAEN